MEAATLPTSSADVLLIQETKLASAEGVQKPARRGKSFGWNCAASSAHRTAADRASGGCAVASKRSIGIAGHAHVTEGFRHRMHLAWVGGVMRGGVHCGSIWLRDSEGLSSENMLILDHAAASLGKLKGPWILGGDWNLTPQVLLESNWLEVVRGVIVAPRHPTCNGKVYDFFVVAEGLVPAIAGIVRIDNAGLHPHWPSRLLIRGDARRHMVRQLVRDPCIPGALPMGPLPEANLPGPEVKFDTEGELATATRSWYETARGEWASFTQEECRYAGARFRWVRRP